MLALLVALSLAAAPLPTTWQPKKATQTAQVVTALEQIRASLAGLTASTPGGPWTAGRVFTATDANMLVAAIRELQENRPANVRLPAWTFSTGKPISSYQASRIVSALAELQTALWITPKKVNVAGGGTQQFTAFFLDTGPVTGGLVWSVEGTDCGSITQAGFYTAPTTGTPKTCTVRADITPIGLRGDGRVLHAALTRRPPR
jgi:hypothetical protein